MIRKKFNGLLKLEASTLSQVYVVSHHRNLFPGSLMISDKKFKGNILAKIVKGKNINSVGTVWLYKVNPFCFEIFSKPQKAAQSVLITLDLSKFIDEETEYTECSILLYKKYE